MTEVVCVKVKDIRPKYENLKEWIEDDNNIYIARKGIVFINGERYPKKDSIWANPFKTKDHQRDDVIKLYEEYICEKIEEDGNKYDLFSLKNKKLGCWCKPERCHGDILIKLMKEYRFIRNLNNEKVYFSLKKFPNMKKYYARGNKSALIENYSVIELKEFIEKE